MAKIKMSGCVIYALFFFALLRCGSTCLPEPKTPIPIPNPNPASTSTPPTNPNPIVQPEPESDDYDTNPSISGGIRVDPSDPIPYQLSIRYENPKDGIWYHICGGVIVDKRTAITAAHCFENSTDVSRYRVVAAENLLSIPENNEQILPLQKLIIHPKYINFSLGSDIAILHVNQFELNKYARPVFLSSVSNEQLSNKSALISGWGNVSHDSGASNTLQKGTVTIESPSKCLWRLENKLKVAVREGIVCAMNPTTRTCTGDSGGPLVIQNYKDSMGNSRGNLLVGITSFGASNCSQHPRAGAFTEIRHFYHWIQENRALPKSCSDAMKFLPAPRSKKQWIYPHGNTNSKRVEVLCDFETDGGGWTIIQKRISGPKEEFKQNWSNYTQGFGSLDGNFWLGLENIHALTENGDQELRIQLEDFEGEKRWAKYSNFSISDASDFYRLTIGGLSGTAGNAMAYHNEQIFTTLGKDNFYWGNYCLVSYGLGGGWWFGRSGCGWSNLNGFYFEKGETVARLQGIWWSSWKGQFYSMAKTEMKIRRRNP